MTNKHDARVAGLPFRVAVAFTLFFGACGIAMLNGCGASIGLRKTFNEANFEIGKTTKAEVIGYLGLPQQTGRDPLGRVHLCYDGATRLHHAMIPVVIVPGVVSFAAVGPSALGLLNSKSCNHSSGAEYVFDENDKLIAAFLPEK